MKKPYSARYKGQLIKTVSVSMNINELKRCSELAPQQRPAEFTKCFINTDINWTTKKIVIQWSPPDTQTYKHLNDVEYYFWQASGTKRVSHTNIPDKPSHDLSPETSLNKEKPFDCVNVV